MTPVLDGFGLIIAAFSYNGNVSITATSDAKTMPDADKFARYIRESANELEKIILNKQKKNAKPNVEKIQSKTVFNSLRNFLNANDDIRKKSIGVYEIELNLVTSKVNYIIEILEEKVSIRLKKEEKSNLKIEINDDVLLKLHQNKLLLEEATLQGRIKLTGTKKNKEKFMKLMKDFLNK